MSTPPSWGMPYWLAFFAALFGVALGIRRVQYRPVAGFLCAMVALDVARLVLRAVFDLGAPGPYHGAQRVAFHVDELGVLAWPTALAALAFVVFSGRRRPWLVLVPWIGLWGALVALYPSDLVRGDGLRRVYLGAHLVALAAYVVALAGWGAKRVKPDVEHAVVMLLGAGELVRLVGFSGEVAAQWGAWMPPANGVLYAVIVAVEGVALWAKR